eukprot:CAMPEP_0114514314 /NCGR_PEP_ID=MMETSP0109-20121206/16084_1 /TAXON_ID=29199 /ORGANISM="Chlorarachnion reptans, Strain CCCM449" /LENGTH=330 /DNA_ID=CAMNT_0001694339 /DNA_START=257 /DNA_END=1246 /DNA_ORIENTATION=+
MVWNMRFFGGRKSEASYQRAQAYYESMKTRVLKSAVGWELHRALGPMEKEVYDGITFYDMVATRAKVFLANLKAHHWTDFRVEKDKCAMYQFVHANGFPHCPIFKEWDNVQDFAVEGGKIRRENCMGSKNCFVKMCHITMGHLNSAKRIKEALPWSDYIEWAEHLWHKRPIDWDRTWGPYFDQLTSTLKPRVMIQDGFKGGRSLHDAPIELKVEVVWGVAYLAYITVGAHECDLESSIILRDGSVLNYQFKNFLAEDEDQCSKKLLVDRGFMDVVWHMAESFAAALAFDSIRVDIFVPINGDPRDAVVNEISLSSGAGYAWHWKFFSKLW